MAQWSGGFPALRTVSEQAVEKNAWRLLPFLTFAAFVHYMDRTNIAFAALSMNRDLGLTATEFGTASSTFYLGYVLVAIPSSLAMYRYGARRWLACIMICWGLGAATKAFAIGPATLSSIRFIEGAAQAGFFPGVIYYLTLWFPAQYRARALAWFLVSISCVCGYRGTRCCYTSAYEWDPWPIWVAMAVPDRRIADYTIRYNCVLHLGRRTQASCLVNRTGTTRLPNRDC